MTIHTYIHTGGHLLQPSIRKIIARSLRPLGIYLAFEMTKGVRSEKESYYFVVLKKYTNISKYGKDRQNSNHVKTHALRPLGIKTSGHVLLFSCCPGAHHLRDISLDYWPRLQILTILARRDKSVFDKRCEDSGYWIRAVLGILGM